VQSAAPVRRYGLGPFQSAASWAAELMGGGIEVISAPRGGLDLSTFTILAAPHLTLQLTRP
jgi:hypothetical protein